MGKVFNKFVAGVLAAAMTFTILVPVTTYAAENDCTHDSVITVDTIEATCTEPGLYNEVCEICGKILKSDLVREPSGHHFTKATFKDGKISILQCERCDYTESFTPVIDESKCIHPEDSKYCYNYVETTCTKDGYTGDIICNDCGKTIKMGKAEKATGHDWTDGDYVRPTCTEDGSVEYFCENCGETKTEVVKAPGHIYGQYYVLKKPTCTTEGEEAAGCENCVEINTRIIPATGHVWNEGEITVAPTTSSEGVKTFTCTTCGETKTESVEKLPEETKPDKPSEGTTEKPGETKPDTPAEGTTEKPSETKPSTPSKNNTKPSTGETKVPSKKTTYKVGTKVIVSGNTYVVTKVDSEVRFSKAKANIKSLTIPATIKVKGVIYKVTSIGAKAINNNKKIKSITIGANVKAIANKSFNNCPNMKRVTVKTAKLTKKTASKKVFNKVNKKLVVKVPKKVKKSYAKIFKGLTVK